MSYTLSSLVLCDVTPCDTMWHPYKGWKEHLSASLVLLRLDGSQRHWPRWRPPAGPRHSWTAEHLRKFNERLRFQQISTHVNCQLTVNTFQHIKHLTSSYRTLHLNTFIKPCRNMTLDPCHSWKLQTMTQDLSRQLSQTVVRPFSYQIEKRLHGPHSPLIFRLRSLEPQQNPSSAP